MKILLVGSRRVKGIDPTPIESQVPVNQYLLPAKIPNTNLIRTGSIAGIACNYFSLIYYSTLESGETKYLHTYT